MRRPFWHRPFVQGLSKDRLDRKDTSTIWRHPVRESGRIPLRVSTYLFSPPRSRRSNREPRNRLPSQPLSAKRQKPRRIRQSKPPLRLGRAYPELRCVIPDPSVRSKLMETTRATPSQVQLDLALDLELILRVAGLPSLFLVSREGRRANASAGLTGLSTRTRVDRRTRNPSLLSLLVSGYADRPDYRSTPHLSLNSRPARLDMLKTTCHHLVYRNPPCLVKHHALRTRSTIRLGHRGETPI